MIEHNNAWSSALAASLAQARRDFDALKVALDLPDAADAGDAIQAINKLTHNARAAGKREGIEAAAKRVDSVEVPHDLRDVRREFYTAIRALLEDKQ